MYNANSFLDGRRTVGTPGANDLNHARAAAQSGLVLGALGQTTSRRFPQGTIVSPRPTRRGGGSVGTSYPWQMDLSPFVGSGTDPHAADRKMRVKFIVPGDVAGSVPTGMHSEYLCYGDPAALTIVESAAVVTAFAVKVPVSESSLGRGDLSVDKGIIVSFQGEDLSDGGFASAPPADGSLPAYAYKMICRVYYWGGALHIQPGVNTYLDLGLAISGQVNCGTMNRTFVWTRTLGG